MPSSVIRHFQYDQDRRELKVHCVSGRRYVYLQVHAKIAEDFKMASSKGMFFNAYIRDHFACREQTEF